MPTYAVVNDVVTIVGAVLVMLNNTAVVFSGLLESTIIISAPDLTAVLSGIVNAVEGIALAAVKVISFLGSIKGVLSMLIFTLLVFQSVKFPPETVMLWPALTSVALNVGAVIAASAKPKSSNAVSNTVNPKLAFFIFNILYLLLKLR